MFRTKVDFDIGRFNMSHLKIRSLLSLAALAATSAGAPFAAGQTGPTAKAFSLANSAQISIDGDLSDWDLLSIPSTPVSSPAPLLGHVPKTEELQAAFRVATDRDFIYVAISATSSASGVTIAPGAQLADVEIYGGTSLRALNYKRFRGLDGKVVLSAAAAGGSYLGGAVRLPYGAEPGQLVECPYLWDLMGARSAVKPVAGGYTAEIAIPVRALDWQQANAAGTLQMNVRVFGTDTRGSRVAVQWATDPLNTSEFSHELLGTVSPTGSPGETSLARSAAGPVDPTTESLYTALRQMAAGYNADAVRLLDVPADARYAPLLSVALERAGQHEASRSLIQRLAVSANETIGRWAQTRLALSEALVAVLPAGERKDREFAGAASEAANLAKLGKWTEAIPAFRNIAEAGMTPVGYRSWALFHVQKGQDSLGDAAGSIATALKLQQTGADGDPWRRAGFDLLIESWYSRGESLGRARVAAGERKPAVSLSSLFATALRDRRDGAGCKQALEIGELLRVEGLPRQALERYQSASEMAGCPREDRAWALLLLQKTQSTLGEFSLAISTAGRINSEFADEWDIREASLRDAAGIPAPGNAAVVQRRLAAEFQRDMGEAIKGGNPLESTRAKLLLGQLNQAQSQGFRGVGTARISQEGR